MAGRITSVCLALAMGGGIALADVGDGEAERVYFTPQRIEVARRNVREHAWAKRQLEEILTAGPISPRQSIVADAYIGAKALVEKSYDDLYAMMPPITVPRQDGGASVRLCPVHGEDIRRVSGHRPWNLDFEKHPWKVICPVGGEVYPSNDFAAGDLTGGEFPDDGTGILVDGTRYPVIRYYAHMAYLQRVYPGIRSLAAAYVLTGEERYGEKCAVLLAALAANFPGPDHHSEHCFDGAYGRRSGMVTDYIWECITMPRLALAYDAIKPVYSRSPELVAYLRGKGLPAESPAVARRFVEQRVFRQGMQALLDGAISGNPGHHQRAAVTLALIMDDFDADRHPNSLDMIEYTYYQGHAPAGYVFANFLTRDGGGFEGPGYDRIKFNYIEVAKRMELVRARHPDLIDQERYPPLLDEPKAQAMYEFYLDITLHDAFSPEVGDSGGARLKPGFIPPRFISIYPHFYADGFRIYREPRYATALLGLDNEMPSGGDLFEASVEADARAAAQLSDAAVRFETRLLDHYGFAMLRDANSEVLTNYSALKGHYQDDFLSLYLYAHEVSLLPDLGYPFTWAYRWQWDANSYTHNTVTVDGAPPLTPPIVPRGWVSLIGSSEHVQASIIAHDCYNPAFNHSPFKRGEQYAEKHPPVERYERATVLIDVGDGSSYVVDVFFVDGGSRHDQSWHSALVEPRLPEGDWQPQPGGTAAGPEVAYGESYVNPRGREVTDGLCYVTDVQRLRTEEPARFDWAFDRLAEPAGLRLHVVPAGGPVELIYGKGRSPARPKNWRLPYLFVRHEGDDGLASRFVTILEPYRGGTAAGIRAVRVEGDTIIVEREDATDTITVRAPKPAGVLHRGQPRNVSIEVTTPRGSVRFDNNRGGRILALDRGTNTITVDADVDPTWVRIFSEGRSSVYTVASAEKAGAGSTRLRLEETSLLGRARATGYEDGVIRNGAPLPFATGSVTPDGNYLEGTCRYAGARAETADGVTSLRLRGVDGQQWITGIAGYDLYVEPALGAAELEATFGNGPITLHDYGLGDRIEIMR